MVKDMKKDPSTFPHGIQNTEVRRRPKFNSDVKPEMGRKSGIGCRRSEVEFRGKAESWARCRRSGKIKTREP